MEPSLIWVTASRPINAKTHSGEKIFQPGEAFQVNPVKARPLIEKKILKEVVAPPDGLIEGCFVEWQSPIFGVLSGRVQMIPDDGSVLVNHPLNNETFGLAFIHVEWVTRVIPRPLKR